MKITIEELKKKVSKDSVKSYIQLVKWLYDNHRDILREWESTQGKFRVEFV